MKNYLVHYDSKQYACHFLNDYFAVYFIKLNLNVMLRRAFWRDTFRPCWGILRRGESL